MSTVRISIKKKVEKTLAICTQVRYINLLSRLTVIYIRFHGQAVKTSPFHGGNTGSIPVGVINADVAQLAEQLICNQQVIGSSPPGVVRMKFYNMHAWDLSSAGRASALQAEGHRFEPCRSHL